MAPANLDDRAAKLARIQDEIEQRLDAGEPSPLEACFQEHSWLADDEDAAQPVGVRK